MAPRAATDTDQRGLGALGATIRDLREAAGETKSAAAVAMRMTRYFLIGIETGERNVSVERLFDIADQYRVRPASLLERVT